MSYSSSLRFHDSSYFTQKMLLCITDLCNSGVFHSELRHGCGGNEGFTSRVNRNLWEEKKMKFTKFSEKPWVYTRTLMTPLSTAPPWNNPSSCHFTSTKSIIILIGSEKEFGKLFLASVCIWTKQSDGCVPLKAKMAHALVHYLVNQCG